MISETVTELIEIGCFLLSSLLLIRTGEKLKSKDILGVKEIALGALQLYLLSSVLPKAGTWSVLWFLLIAFYLFCLLDGALALVHSILAKWSADTSDLLTLLQDKDILKTASAMLEAKVKKEKISELLMKYWDLRPSEAEDFIQEAGRRLK